MFRRTTAINKMLAMKARKKVVQGGTGAGKTNGIIPILIDKAAKIPGLKITVVAETIPAVKDGPADIFKTVMQQTNRWRDDGWIGSPMEYKFVNGSRIQFKAFDTEGKAKVAGKRDILFINEANHVDYAIADALMIRSKETWIDYNSDFKFWGHTEVLTEPNSELLILNYKDNEACPEETLEDLIIKKGKAFHNPDLPDDELFNADNIISDYWANWWRVYGIGETGTISALRIMPILRRCKAVPEDAVEIPSYLDFGFDPHPTSFGKLWVRKNPKIDELYIKQIVYSTRLSINAKEPEEGTSNLCDLLDERKIDKNHLIIAESADPRAVSDMKAAGYNVTKVVKKSVEVTLRTFHEYKIFFVESEYGDESFHEFDNYKKKRDKKTGEILNTPEDNQPDHTIDGVRYVLQYRGTRWSV